MEEWAPVGEDFPDYSVSTYGQVRNHRTGNMISQQKNNTGYMKVSIYNHNGDRKTFEVTKLVARTFLPSEQEGFDTPIHLDGNKEHTFLDNLAWRPRWFAARYHAQFKTSKYRTIVPIVEERTKRVFDNSLEAAVAFGVLEKDILLSLANHTGTFPGGYSFYWHSDA